MQHYILGSELWAPIRDCNRHLCCADDGSLPFQPQRDYEDQIQQPDPPGSSEDQVAPADEITIDDEKRTAILGAMKNIKLDYMPSWAVHLSQRDWDNTVAHIAVKQSKS